MGSSRSVDVSADGATIIGVALGMSGPQPVKASPPSKMATEAFKTWYRPTSGADRIELMERIGTPTS